MHDPPPLSLSLSTSLSPSLPPFLFLSSYPALPCLTLPCHRYKMATTPLQSISLPPSYQKQRNLYPNNSVLIAIPNCKLLEQGIRASVRSMAHHRRSLPPTLSISQPSSKQGRGGEARGAKRERPTNSRIFTFPNISTRHEHVCERSATSPAFRAVEVDSGSRYLRRT